MSTKVLFGEVWTVYDRPTDYPNHFVLRCWHVIGGTPMPNPHCYLADTLEGIRMLVPPGLNRMERRPEDDEKIVENWL
jgi:hypothetical protein